MISYIFCKDGKLYFVPRNQ